jgi:hypothetical protein
LYSYPHLGFFTNLKDAAAARKEAEEILYNKFLTITPVGNSAWQTQWLNTKEQEIIFNFAKA